MFYKEVIGWHGLSHEPTYSSAPCGEKYKNMATKNLKGTADGSQHSWHLCGVFLGYQENRCENQSHVSAVQCLQETWECLH